LASQSDCPRLNETTIDILRVAWYDFPELEGRKRRERQMKKLVPLFLAVLVVSITACGEIPWIDLPPTLPPVPEPVIAVPAEELAEESIGTLIPGTVEPTMEIPQQTTELTATPPAVTPEPSSVFGPPPIINLTVVYPDGGSIAVPIACPVPAEFCETGVDIYDENGDYIGLGFSLPAGTPIFAVVADDHFGAIRAFQTFDYKIGDYAYFRRIETQLVSTSNRLGTNYIYKPNRCTTCVFVRYDYSGLSDPLDKALDRFHYYAYIRPEAGEEIGRVNDPSISLLGMWHGNIYKADGQRMTGVNFVFWVKTFWGYTADECRYVMLPIHFDCRPTPTPEPTPTIEPTPEPTSELSLTEISVACPVPAEYCRTATEIFRDDGGFLGLGFSLPEGTSVLAVADGKLERFDGGWWGSASEPQSRYYPTRYTLTVGDVSFHYSLVDDSPPASLSATEVKAGQELGKAKYKHDKCVGRCWAKFDPFNLIFHASPEGDVWKQPLQIRIN